MRTMFFKTDVNDETGLRALRERFRTENRIFQWDLNLSHPDRLLEVYSDELSPEAIEVMVQEAGFRAWFTAAPEKH